MKVQDFVKLVEEEERAEEEAEIQRREELVSRALPLFVENVQVWTSGLEEYEPGEIRIEWDQHDLFRMHLPFTWDGLRGEICSAAWGGTTTGEEWGERPSRLKLWWGSGEKQFEDYYLPGDGGKSFEVNYCEEAALLDPLDLGRLLVEVLSKRKAEQEERQFWGVSQ